MEAQFGSPATATSRRAVAEAVVDYLAPIRERYGELRADEGRLEADLARGGAVARPRDRLGRSPTCAR